MYRLIVLLVIILMAGCGRFGSAEPTQTPHMVFATPANANPANANPEATPFALATIADVTPWSISVNAGGIEFEADLHNGGGDLTITDDGIESSGGGLMDVKKIQVRPLPTMPWPTLPPAAATAPDVAAAPPVATPRSIVDHPYCDDLFADPRIKGSLCRAYKDFEIDQRCIDDFSLAIELDRAGWPRSVIPEAITEITQESNGCIAAVDGGAIGIAGIHWLGHTKTGWDARRPVFPEYEDQNPYDVRVNLSLARAIWERSGFAPWRGGVVGTPTPRPIPSATVAPVAPVSAETVAPTPLPPTPPPTLPPPATLTPIPTASAAPTESPTAAPTPTALPAPTKQAQATPTGDLGGDDCFLADATQPGNTTGVKNEACEVTRVTGCDLVERNPSGGWLCREWFGNPVQVAPVSAIQITAMGEAVGLNSAEIAEFVAAAACTGSLAGYISGTAREAGFLGVNTDWLRTQGVNPLAVNLFDVQDGFTIAFRMWTADGGFFRFPANCATTGGMRGSKTPAG